MLTSCSVHPLSFIRNASACLSEAEGCGDTAGIVETRLPAISTRDGIGLIQVTRPNSNDQNTLERQKIDRHPYIY